MRRTNIKIGLIMLSIVLFASCKSSESENNNRTTQRAQGGPPSVEQLLEEMDSDNDEKLSESEVKGPLKNDFSKIDTNGDGYITEEELKNAPKQDKQGGGGKRPQGRN